MIIIGHDLLLGLADEGRLKMVFNANGAILFPATLEHRDQKTPGISYEDDYQGNALAAMAKPGALEVRYHARFTAAQVKTMLRRLAAQPELTNLSAFEIYYSGQRLP
jgi:hypothetical protein